MFYKTFFHLPVDYRTFQSNGEICRPACFAGSSDVTRPPWPWLTSTKPPVGLHPCFMIDVRESVSLGAGFSSQNKFGIANWETQSVDSKPFHCHHSLGLTCFSCCRQVFAGCAPPNAPLQSKSQWLMETRGNTRGTVSQCFLGHIFMNDVTELIERFEKKPGTY